MASQGSSNVFILNLINFRNLDQLNDLRVNICFFIISAELLLVCVVIISFSFIMNVVH